MQKLSRYFLIFIVGILGVGLTIGLCLKPSTEPVLANLSTSSSIFKEVQNDGLASYLEITIPELSTNVSSVKVSQTIGTASYSPTTDELGNTCYYSNVPTVADKSLTYRFTRPATYTVQYILSNGNIITESCTFSPEINTSVLNALYTTPDGTTQNKIASTSENHIFTSAGTLSIPTDSHGLYTISASTSSSTNDDLLTEIPDNSYGEITYTITSTNGHTSLTQKISVLTVDFSIEFKDYSNNPLVKENYENLGGYVFNQSVKFSVEVEEDMQNLSGDTLSTSEKFEIFDLLNFSLQEVERNETNDASKISSTTTLTSSNGIISHTIDACDHSIFSIVTNLKNSTNEFKNNLPKLKIITKVPTNDNGEYVISAVLGQVENFATNNYIDGVLGGYIPNGTIIYYPANAVRVFYNGYTNQTTPLHYDDGSTGTIKKSENKDFRTDNSTIVLKNETATFDEFFSFSFKIKTYSDLGGNDETNGFYPHMLHNNMRYNGTSTITNLFTYYDNSLTNPISSFSYTVPSNYEIDCIPMYIRVTYNGTTFDNIYDLSAGDKLDFTAYGNYTIEFYNVPNYDFIVRNLDNLAVTHYLYKLDFVISGPSIIATTTDNNGNTLTVSDHIYTQNRVDFEVTLEDGQTAVVYRNGNEFARRTENWAVGIDKNSGFGTWEIAIIDASNNKIKSLTFTLVDNLYQGFSINDHDEYAKLLVSTQISKMPEIYQPLETASAYHLTQAGTYKIDIDAKEELLFNVNSAPKSAYTINSNTIVVEIAKSYFTLYYAEGTNGSRISSAITISAVAGVQLQSLEVYRNNKLIETFDATQLADWNSVVENSRTFSDNGTYTFKLTDKFGNTYESQIEKYYKVNFALIMLIILAVAGAVILVAVIIKSRHKINVK